MGERLDYNAPSVFTERQSAINYDDGTVDMMSQLSGAFLGVAQKAHRAQLESEVAQAQKDGALAGSVEGASFKPSKRRGIVHRTYNDSGIQTATVKMSVGTQKAIQRIAMSNPGNPGVQEKQMMAWADKFASELPDGMVQPFRTNFEQLASSQITKANSELSKIRQSEAIAEFNDLENTLVNSLENFAPRMFENGAVGTDAAQAVETLRKNYIEMLAQNGPGAEYSVGGYKIPAGAGRSGAFSVEQIGKKIEAFDVMILSSAVKGDFLRELEAGRGTGSYFNFIKGNTSLTTVDANGGIRQVSVDNILRNDDKEKLASFMRTHISTLNSMEAAIDRKADRASEKYNEAIINNAVQSAFKTVEQPDGTQIVQGDPDVLRLQYLNAVNDDSGLVSLETIEGLQGLMETVGTGDIPDPAVVSKTNLDIIERNIKSVSQLPNAGLGDQERAKMVELTRKINSGQHWSNSQRYTTMIDLGQSALAQASAAGFTLFSDPRGEQAADFAEYKSRLMNEMMSAEASGILPIDVNAMPGQGEFDIQKRGQEIIKEIKERRKSQDADPEIDALNSQIKELTDIVNNSDTPNKERRRATDKKKKLMDEKARLQTKRIMGTR